MILLIRLDFCVCVCVCACVYVLEREFVFVRQSDTEIFINKYHLHFLLLYHLTFHVSQNLSDFGCG